MTVTKPITHSIRTKRQIRKSVNLENSVIKHTSKNKLNRREPNNSKQEPFHVIIRTKAKDSKLQAF